MVGHGSVRAPDLIVPTIGFRHWNLRDGFLTSPYITDCVWDEPEMTAGCFTHQGTAKNRHPAPDQECECGFYVYYDQPTVAIGTVPGAVTVSGRLQAHEKGMRVQHIKVVALGYVKPVSLSDESAQQAKEENARLREIAKGWGIPIVTADELPEIAAKYGEPMPPQLIKRIKAKNEAARRAAEKVNREARLAREVEMRQRDPLPNSWRDYVKRLLRGE